MTSATVGAAAADAPAAAGEAPHRVALAVEHADEPGGDRVVVLHEQDPRAAHGASVPAPVPPRREALTWR